MKWHVSHRCDPQARALADRHYNRQHTGAANFVKPGRCLVLRTANYRALWVTSWPYAEYVKHAWAGAWECSLFRREGGSLASVLIRQAVAATRWAYGDPPPLGMITFIDTTKVRPQVDMDGRPSWGWTYRQAGFVEAGYTVGGLLTLQLLPAAMPNPAPPLGAQLRLMGVAA